MAEQITFTGPHKDFEGIKKIDENGIEYWMARELMRLLGYSEWRNFEEVISKAARAAIESGQVVDNHFVAVNKMVKIGSNTVREVRDWKLDRYGCYLVAQNGDSSKPEIALAQSYFAIQTRKLELSQLTADEQRLFIRDEVRKENKKLAGTAKNAGVTHFGSFNDAGYRGLYGLSLKDLERVKGVERGELLDRAGSTELAANLFRITQTNEKIKNTKMYGQEQASSTHFMVGGKVRQTIKDIGGVLPEKLPAEKHIRELKKEVKKLKGKKK
jgi:DNA-damage-inducible protein D